MQKLKKILTGFVIHCILSFAILGSMRVYQNGYNKMHYEQLRMASVSVQEENTQIQVLHQKWNLKKFSEDDVIYYLAYILTDKQLHGWLFFLNFIKIS
ncbi:MAG: hypothetical protein K2G88_05620 [Oscillospiraceae bacterium]|nr:hypothetical protein [Oscillospiraceae bacterium]